MRSNRFFVAAALVLAWAGPVVAKEILTVGSTPTGVPFTFLNTKTNTIQGIMVDLIEAIGKDVGFEVKIEPMQFSSLIAGLNAHKIDIIFRRENLRHDPRHSAGR